MRKSEKTRQFIVEKTAPVFNRKGYAGTSLSDLTEATGLTKGSIYGNFSGKEDVALAVFDYNLSQLTGRIEQELLDKGTCKEKLQVYAYIYPQLFSTMSSMGGCPILNTATEADDTHPLLREKAAQAIRSWEKKIVTIVKKGIQNGEFQSNISPEETAVGIIALIEGSIMMAKVCGSTRYLTSAMKMVEKTIAALH